MVLGDFGNHGQMGFDTPYAKTVDKPMHFRAKPKQTPRPVGPSWGFSTARNREPMYEKSARFGCRANDHTDMLAAQKSGPGYEVNTEVRMSKKMVERPATLLVKDQVIGGRPGTEDPLNTAPITVGKKLLPNAAQTRCAVNIANPSTMPPFPPQQRKKEAAFSNLNEATMGDPNMYIKPSKGKKQSSGRSVLTTGANELLRWDEQ